MIRWWVPCRHTLPLACLCLTFDALLEHEPHAMLSMDRRALGHEHVVMDAGGQPAAAAAYSAAPYAQQAAAPVDSSTATYSSAGSYGAAATPRPQAAYGQPAPSAYAAGNQAQGQGAGRGAYSQVPAAAHQGVAAPGAQTGGQLARPQAAAYGSVSKAQVLIDLQRTFSCREIPAGVCCCDLHSMHRHQAALMHPMEGAVPASCKRCNEGMLFFPKSQWHQCIDRSIQPY